MQALSPDLRFATFWVKGDASRNPFSNELPRREFDRLNDRVPPITYLLRPLRSPSHPRSVLLTQGLELRGKGI
jgi:hypothetical protein